MNFLENEFFLLAVTFGIFFLAKLLQKKTGIMLLNPILLTIAILIVFLKMTHISYETYNEGGHLIEFWLKPAVVALGVPLYLQLETIKKQLRALARIQSSVRPDCKFRRRYLSV
jgi:putative effector of murein hydrolase